MAILFRIKPGREEILITRPDKIAQASLFLRDEIQNVSDDGTVDLMAHEPATHAASIKCVLEHLEYDLSDAQGRDCDAKSLADICNVLVDYQCDPECFLGLWGRLTQQSSRNQGGQRRCWGTKIPTKETLTAAQLAISALVLGREQALESELGVIVWALDTKLNTTVPELQDLQSMNEELPAIYAYLLTSISNEA